MMEDSSQSGGVGVGSIIGNKFRLEEKLGQGSFGMIFRCVNTESSEVNFYAMKLEKRNSRHSSMLVREIKVMIELKNELGFPRMVSYGKDDEYNYVVMSCLGRNLDSILKKCSQRFTLATCMNIADQMLTRLEVLHQHSLIHRDIKPENFVIGFDRNFHHVYLIDFGLAKYYKDGDGNHIPLIEKKGMIGTARYASLNAHLGQEQSRRDDLEALAYVLIYFIRGKLPWQQIYAETKEEKYEKIKNMKMNQPLESLCEGCPLELVQYLKIVRKLEFTEQPNYAVLKALFRKVITDKKLTTQAQIVDWETLPEYRNKKKNTANSIQLAQIPTQKEISMRQQIHKQLQEQEKIKEFSQQPKLQENKLSLLASPQENKLNENHLQETHLQSKDKQHYQQQNNNQQPQNKPNLPTSLETLQSHNALPSLSQADLRATAAAQNQTVSTRDEAAPRGIQTSPTGITPKIASKEIELSPTIPSIIGQQLQQQHVASESNQNNSVQNVKGYLLKVPTRETGQNVSVLSVNSLGDTSRLNNYNFSIGTSDSEGVLEEGGIAVSSNIINKNAHVTTTSEIRRDIRSRSNLRMSQLDFHDLGSLAVTNGHVISASFNGLAKVPSTQVVYTMSNVHLVGQVTPLDVAFQPYKCNNIGTYCAEDIKEHQDDEISGDSYQGKKLKMYKTQVTPITEVKESTYKSRTSKNAAGLLYSSIGSLAENITEGFSERPIIINVMPIKFAFKKQAF